CSSDLRASGRTPRSVSGEPSEAAPSGPTMPPRPRAAHWYKRCETGPADHECASDECPKSAIRSPRQAGSNGHQVSPKLRTAVALALSRLTPELSRAAKRRRLGRIVRPQPPSRQVPSMRTEKV